MKNHKHTRREATGKTIRFFESVLDGSDDVILITDFANTIIEANRRFAEIFGESTNHIRETGLFFWLEKIDPGAPKEWGKHISRLYSEKTSGTFEYRVSDRFFEIKNSLVEAGKDNQAVLWIWRDITERKKQDQEREALLHNMKERIKELQCIYGITNSIEKQSSLEEIFKNVLSLIPKGWQYPEITKARIVFDGQEYILAPFEKTIWKLETDLLVDGQNRGILAVYYLREQPRADEGPFLKEERQLLDSIATDLCKAIRHREAEDSLHESERRFRDILENVQLATVLLDDGGHITFCNDFLLELTGWAREEVLGESWFDLFIPSDSDVRELFFDSIAKNTVPAYYENEICMRTGGRRLVAWNNMILRGIHGNIIGATSIGEDITERRRAEVALLNSEQQLRALAVRIEEVAEAERKELARELHDRVGQNLSALNINLNIIKTFLPDDSGQGMADRLTDSMTLVEETTQHIRDVMADLRPAVLDDYGLMAALRWYCERFSERNGVKVNIHEQTPSLRPAPAIELMLFRIAQEALVNVAKHAGADQVVITLGETRGILGMTITDDGCGFNPHDIHQQSEGHWGLMTIRERVTAFGGKVRFESEPGGGTRVSIEVSLCP